jgi:hypothetical protein
VEVEAARAQAQEAADQAAQEREERRLEAVEASAREEKQVLQREIDRMKSDNDRKIDLLQQESKRQSESMERQLEAIQQANQSQQDRLMTQLQGQQSQGGSDMISKMMEMQMLQVQQAQARTEQERLDREMRWREEAVVRKEEAERRDREYKKDRVKQEEVQKSESDREERRRSEMLTFLQQGQQTPDQMLTMLKTLVDMNPRKDATSQIMDLAQAAVAMREIIGGNEQAEGKWESIIRTGGEALSKAVGEIQQKRAAAQPQVPVQVPGQVPVPVQYQQVPGPNQHQPQYHRLPAPQGPAHPQMVQAPPPPDDGEPNPEEWGRILGFVVKSQESGNEPSETATHLYTMIMVGMQRPRAVERLSGSTLEELEFQLRTLKLHPQVASSSYVEQVDGLLAMLSNRGGREWLAEVIANLAAVQAEANHMVMARQFPQPAGEGQETSPRPEDMTPEEFSAQSRGTSDSQEQYRNPPEEGSSEDFSRQARGEDPPPPSGGWAEPPVAPPAPPPAAPST